MYVDCSESLPLPYDNSTTNVYVSSFILCRCRYRSLSFFHILLKYIHSMRYAWSMKQCSKHTSVVAYSVFYEFTLNEFFWMKLFVFKYFVILWFRISILKSQRTCMCNICMQNRLASVSMILLRFIHIPSIKWTEFATRSANLGTGIDFNQNWPTDNLCVNLNLSSLHASNGSNNGSCH